jgi:hypothetical protein
MKTLSKKHPNTNLFHQRISTHILAIPGISADLLRPSNRRGQRRDDDYVLHHAASPFFSALFVSRTVTACLARAERSSGVSFAAAAFPPLRPVFWKNSRV